MGEPVENQRDIDGHGSQQLGTRPRRRGPAIGRRHGGLTARFRVVTSTSGWSRQAQVTVPEAG